MQKILLKDRFPPFSITGIYLYHLFGIFSLRLRVQFGDEVTMPLGLLGTKVGMTQVYDSNGDAAPVTVLQLGPCPVLQIRTPERDGYHAVQVGFKDKSRKKASRAERGHVASDLESKRKKKRINSGVVLLPKANVEPQRFIREFRLTKPATVAVGEKLTVGTVFKDVKAVDVIGTTKGRGFSGVIKRWGFGGLPAAHGAKKVHREVGSTASLASNRGSGRPKKGKKLPGQYGSERVTVRNLEVIRIDEENNLLLVRGAVPGYNNGLVMVRPTNKL
jgi:large subunit ribosomal protein L3